MYAVSLTRNYTPPARAATGAHRLASAGRDNTIIVWDISSGKSIRVFRGHTLRIECVAWSPNDKHLATGSLDKTAKVWDVATGKVLVTYNKHTEQVRGVAWKPDGKKLAMGSADSTVRIWDLAEYLKP